MVQELGRAVSLKLFEETHHVVGYDINLEGTKSIVKETIVEENSKIEIRRRYRLCRNS